MVMEYFSHELYLMNRKFQKNIILYAEFLYMDSTERLSRLPFNNPHNMFSVLSYTCQV